MPDRTSHLDQAATRAACVAAAADRDSTRVLANGEGTTFVSIVDFAALMLRYADHLKQAEEAFPDDVAVRRAAREIQALAHLLADLGDSTVAEMDAMVDAGTRGGQAGEAARDLLTTPTEQETS